MTHPAYPAARIVAPKIEAHFAQHIAEAQRRGVAAVAAPPDAQTFEALIDAAFWASLRREESYAPKISMTFVSPDAAAYPLRFERPLSLDPGALIRSRRRSSAPASTSACGAIRRAPIAASRSGEPSARFRRCRRSSRWRCPGSSS